MCRSLLSPAKGTIMFHDRIPHTREGARLAAVMAVIQRATPWLRVEGIFAPDPDHGYVLCFDEQRHIVVGFDTLSSWQTYRQVVGAVPPEREIIV